MVLHSHEMFPLLMPKEKRIEVRQKADLWAFELSACQFVEICSKDRGHPTLDIDGRQICLLTGPDLAGLRKRDAGP